MLKLLRLSKHLVLFCTLTIICSFHTAKLSAAQEFRLGIIGLDTLHSTVFSRIINDRDNETDNYNIRVIAAYPYGSTRIAQNAEHIPKYSKEIQGYGVSIEPDLDKLINSVDGIMLMTNDGTMHLQQIMPVFKAGKPVFLDKPVAANLVDAIKIYQAAEKYDVPLFSASALRYLDKAQSVRHANAVGKVLGADGYSPMYLEPQHTDYYWYAMHSVETIYTLLGPGCKRVKRIIGEYSDLIIGEWADGRIGTVRADRGGRQFYGGIAYGSDTVLAVGPFKGYEPLVHKIIEFFRTGKSPVAAAETLEIYTFMQAADISKQKKGKWVELATVFAKAKKQAEN